MSISFQNSLTTRNITSPFLFTGEYVDITAYAEVNVLLQGTLPLASDYYVVTAYLSNDSGKVPCSNTLISAYAVISTYSPSNVYGLVIFRVVNEF